MKERKIFVLSLLIVLCYSNVHKRINSHQNSHFRQTQGISHRLDGQQCVKVGGHICGNVFQDCCKEGCYKVIPFVGPEKCLNDNYLVIPQQYCEDVCKQKSGVLCSNVFQDPECCPQQSCNKGLMNKCDQAKRINITGCHQKGIMDTVSGLVNNLNINFDQKQK